MPASTPTALWLDCLCANFDPVGEHWSTNWEHLGLTSARLGSPAKAKARKNLYSSPRSVSLRAPAAAAIRAAPALHPALPTAAAAQNQACGIPSQGLARWGQPGGSQALTPKPLKLSVTCFGRR